VDGHASGQSPASHGKWLMPRNADVSAPPLHLVDRLNSQAIDRPEALAVADVAGSRLTYGELWQRAGALARTLRAAGAGPDDRVALIIDPGAELIVAMVGALRAGVAYVPLSQADPVERLTAVAKDVGAVALLVSAAHRERLTGLALPVIEVSKGAGRPDSAEPLMVDVRQNGSGSPRTCRPRAHSSRSTVARAASSSNGKFRNSSTSATPRPSRPSRAPPRRSAGRGRLAGRVREHPEREHRRAGQFPGVGVHGVQRQDNHVLAPLHDPRLPQHRHVGSRPGCGVLPGDGRSPDARTRRSRTRHRR
jgi:hypothetical protein